MSVVLVTLLALPASLRADPSPCTAGCPYLDTHHAVNACFNGPGKYGYGGLSSCGGETPGFDGLAFQCVELVRRFYREALCVDTHGWTGQGKGNARDYWDTYAEKGLVRFENGKNTTSPRENDIVVFETAAPQGHVAIVKSVDLEGGMVTFIEQNSPWVPTLSLRRDATSGFWSFGERGPTTKTLGWLRATAARLAASVQASPMAGQAPLTVTLKARQCGTSTGTINYNLWWHCPNLSNSVEQVEQDSACGTLPVPSLGACAENANGYKCLAVLADSIDVAHNYTTAGTYSPKVIVERGSAAPAQAHAAVVATTLPPCTPTITPGTTSFPSVPVGNCTPDRGFTIKNPVGCARLIGTATVATPFNVSAGANISLSAGGTQSVLLRHCPTQPGPVTSSVAISTNAGGFTQPLRAFGCSVTQATIGSSMTGTLTQDDCPAPNSPTVFTDVYTFQGTTGQTLRIQMTSSQFAPTINLWDGQHRQFLGYASGTSSALLTRTLSYTGTYEIEARSTYAGATGAYDLLVSLTEP